MWYRLCVDVRPDGTVANLSWEKRDDDGHLTSMSTWTTARDVDSMHGALSTLWSEVAAREGLVPFP